MPRVNASMVELLKALWYEWLRLWSRLFFVTVYRCRCQGRELVPTDGGGIVVSNHQSHFDPVLVGMACPPRLHFLARSGLFRSVGFGLLIRSLNAIPVERDGLGLEGLRETIRRLKAGKFVLVFPEGTRTPDGELHAIKPGLATVAKRAGVPIVPVALVGAFEIWPRQQHLPNTEGWLEIVFGEPITPEAIARLDQRALILEVERRMRECFEHARQLRRRRMPKGRPVDKRPVDKRPVDKWQADKRQAESGQAEEGQVEQATSSE